MFPIDVATATTGTQLGKHYFQTKINYSTPSPREEKCKIEQETRKKIKIVKKNMVFQNTRIREENYIKLNF